MGKKSVRENKSVYQLKLKRPNSVCNGPEILHPSGEFISDTNSNKRGGSQQLCATLNIYSASSSSISVGVLQSQESHWYQPRASYRSNRSSLPSSSVVLLLIGCAAKYLMASSRFFASFSDGSSTSTVMRRVFP